MTVYQLIRVGCLPICGSDAIAWLDGRESSGVAGYIESIVCHTYDEIEVVVVDDLDVRWTCDARFVEVD